MTPAPRPADDVALWCGSVFEAFALTVEDVVDCHDQLPESVGSIAELVRTVRNRPGRVPDPVTFVRETLVASGRGIDAPARYWANAPEVHLDALFAPFGCRVTVEWRREDTRRIVLEDAVGTEFRATLTYPETPLGQDNYPALLDAVNRELLDGTGVELVLLAGPEERWQFALGETAALDNLRERYGETIRLGDRRLLAADQPGAYVPGGDGTIPVPDWADDDGEDDGLAFSFETTGESFAELVDRIDRSAGSFEDVTSDADATPNETVGSGNENVGSDEIGAESPDGGDGRDAAAGRDPEDDRAANDGRDVSPASDDEITDLFDDLSDVWPPASPAARDEASTPVLGDEGDPPEADQDDIDRLFDSIEQDVVDESRDAADREFERAGESAAVPPAVDDETVEEALRDADDAASASVESVDLVGDDRFDVDECEFVWLDDGSLVSRE